jgi:transitional endoplasmic reticulum ATPase
MAQIANGQPWARRLAELYESGISQVFALHFNTADYVGNSPLMLREYLSRVTFQKRDVVVIYNPAVGITFAEPEMRRKFDELVGLGGKPDQAVLALAKLTGTPTADTGSNPRPLPRKPEEALSLLTTLLRSSEAQTAVIIEYTESVVPAGDYATMSVADRVTVVTLLEWARDPAIIRAGGVVTLITRNLADLHESLRAVGSRIEAIAIPLPDYEERIAYIQYYLETNEAHRREMIAAEAEAQTETIMGGRPADEDEEGQAEFARLIKQATQKLKTALEGALRLEMPVEVLAKQTAGLARIHIEDILLRAIYKGGLVSTELVSERKQSIIRTEYADVLEVLEPAFGFDAIGGHEMLKTFLRENVIRALKEGDAEVAPLGILLMGPPGTGKTALVIALARESGFNAVNLNLGRILGQYVGNSERNMERVLQAIEALAPVLVFTDEMEQKFQRSTGSDGGSRVGGNLFSRLMEFLADERHRGRIIWLAATNRPDLLDAALRRPGRFDVKAPLLIPTAEEWPDVMRALFIQTGITATLAIEELVPRLNGWTGAEAKTMLFKARQIARRNGRREVTQADVSCAMEVIIPSTSDIELMTALALANCSDLELLPDWAKAQARDRNKLSSVIDKTKSGEPSRRGRREL